MSRLIVVGVAAPDGLYVRQGDGFRKLEPTREPMVVQLADLEPCPCGRVDCDRDEWGELMQPLPIDDACEVCGGLVCDCITPKAQAALLARIDADPHGYNDLTKLDIPF